MGNVVSIRAEMGFAKPEHIVEDADIPGMLRCKTQPVDADYAKVFAFHKVNAVDWLQEGSPRPSLEEMGFEPINLTHIEGLGRIFESICQNNEISEHQAKQLRRKLTLSAFPLANGKKLRFLFIAPEGLIMRKSGPNGLKPYPEEVVTDMNGHDGAAFAHGDQDVNGTPVKQILKGLAPRIFRHKSPNCSNQRSPFFLVNLWIPLQQITRPLALMDRRTLDPKTQQLRYALPIDGFLDRDEKQALNDIWVFRFDEKQRWYFSSEMDSSQAYVFDTLGEPHGAIVLPGEVTAEQYYRALQQVKQAVEREESEKLGNLIDDFKPDQCCPDTPKPLRKAIERFESLMQEAACGTIGSLKSSGWSRRCEVALDSVVRKSIEMRVVAFMA